MQNKLRGWLTDNSVTADPNDQILVLDPAGNVGLPEIYAEMRSEETSRRNSRSCSNPFPTYGGPLPDERL